MPIPPPTLLITTARQRYESLKSGPSIPTMRPVAPLGSFTKVGTVTAPSFDYLAFIDRICNAICGGWNIWRLSAALTGVQINAVNAVGGTVTGPPLGPLILAQAAPQGTEAMKLTQVISGAISTAWQQVTSAMRAPGLPWYPPFAAMPSPVAPPTPNTPTPVAALITTTAPVSKSALKEAMLLSEPNASTEHRNVYESIAEAFEQAVQTWSVTSMVTNVLGTGPVPTFAPPYVPVGPVVGGVGNMTPGGFI
jgi:hypothetical protein